MRKTKIVFTATTVLFIVAMLPGAIMDLVQPDMVVAEMAKIGMPLYVLTLIGVWKLLGLAALGTAQLSKYRESPRIRQISEWAYAGFFFDLTGAVFVHAAGGDSAGVVPPLILSSLLVATYVLRTRLVPASAEHSVL